MLHCRERRRQKPPVPVFESLPRVEDFRTGVPVKECPPDELLQVCSVLLITELLNAPLLNMQQLVEPELLQGSFEGERVNPSLQVDPGVLLQESQSSPGAEHEVCPGSISLLKGLDKCASQDLLLPDGCA